MDRSTISGRLLPGVPLVESPLFGASIDDMNLSAVERDIAIQLNEKGFAVLDFPDDDLDDRIERIQADLEPRYDLEGWRANWRRPDSGPRIQDAWRFNDDVMAIAANPQILSLLEKLYGRRAFPFQTLNFPVGTQQPYHSDSIHFSSVPERFMCGVWLAMEDIDPSSGPLVYYPGSHKWPIIYNDLIGARVARDRPNLPYPAVWAALIDAMGVEPETFCPKKGQCLIWSANLLHGGSAQTAVDRTRWSQVTHYYFDDCAYFTPIHSDPLAGNLALRSITDIATGQAMPNRYVDQILDDLLADVAVPTALGVQETPQLPGDFDPQLYLDLNPDVRDAGEIAEVHYLAFGFAEKRRYR
jgi:hypothetical protein